VPLLRLVAMFRLQGEALVAEADALRAVHVVYDRLAKRADPALLTALVRAVPDRDEAALALGWDAALGAGWRPRAASGVEVPVARALAARGRAGEAFALLMRSDPKLLTGVNKLWIRFFLLAVYATMYVRDHNRPAFHAALGVDPTEYDYKVFAICNQISRQVFPVELDIDAPAFRRQMEKLRLAAERIEEGKARGGVGGLIARASGMAGAGLAFARMYLQKPKSNALPGSIRLQPAW
jgi:hypothetical protein